MENLVAEIRIRVDEKHLEFFVTGNEGRCRFPNNSTK